MRILQGTYRLLDRGGTEMWTRVMHDALSAAHEVHVYTQIGNTLFPDMTEYDPRTRYDLAIINHNETMRGLRKAHADRIIMNIHGTKPALEWPVLGADAYVAVSEWEKAFIPVHSTVIPNPIDTERFSEGSPIAPTLQRVAMLSNYSTPAGEIAAEACRLLGVEIRMGGWTSGRGTTAEPEKLMAWADLVVGVNRTALEALSCGRNVYLMGLWGSGGMVTAENFDELGRTNWSGAERGTWPTPQAMASELMAGYDPERNLRSRILANHHPDIIAQRYLELAASISPVRHFTTAVIRRMPSQMMSAAAMSFLDPLMRELSGRRPIDGRPGVLWSPWREASHSTPTPGEDAH